jgi:hypothetical protein
MPFVAAIVLFWQRRRVVPLLRRAWSALTAGESGAAPAGKRARAGAVGRRAVVGGWRAVDTDANATRVARFVTWMRSLAAGSEVVQAPSAPNTTV